MGFNWAFKVLNCVFVINVLKICASSWSLAKVVPFVCLKIWESQPPGNPCACAGIAVPFVVRIEVANSSMLTQPRIYNF